MNMKEWHAVKCWRVKKVWTQLEIARNCRRRRESLFDNGHCDKKFWCVDWLFLHLYLKPPLVKLGGTHIGVSRLPHELDDNRRIVTVADGDFAEETIRQTATAALKHQTAKVLTFFDLRQRLEQNENGGKIITRPKKAAGGVQTRREAFHRDLLKKFRRFKPEATRVPLRELRQGKVHGVQLLNWPSSVERSANFNEKELEMLERNPVLLVESTDCTDDYCEVFSRSSVEENAAQIENQRNLSGRLHQAAADTEVLDATMSTQFGTPAIDGVTQVHQSAADLDGIDLDAIEAMLAVALMESNNNKQN
ncbi:hypothetical protein BJ741DRAFT_169518 [Chytriomyces cf. hyalinus JEL632]|nr:hypothetical protein BJ741DRAFT_169518 [Chytriomyces cf. hyalinus JEL632]